MSGLTSITDDFGDGVHTFALRFGELEELQAKTGVGPAALLGRMIDGTWRIGDVRETIRLGLIGGGMAAADALTFVRRYVDGEPLNRSLSAAVAIMAVTLNGHRPAGKAQAGDPAAGEPAAAESPTDPAPAGSTSPRSDAPPS